MGPAGRVYRYRAAGTVETRGAVETRGTVETRDTVEIGTLWKLGARWNLNDKFSALVSLRGTVKLASMVLSNDLIADRHS